MIPIDPAISIDGYRYVHIMLDDFREEDISRSPLQWSPEWQDARLDAAVRYMMALEADPDCDQLALVFARHEVMLCRRSLLQQNARRNCVSLEG